MAQEDTGQQAQPGFDWEADLRGEGSIPKEPGWFPTPANPNDQRYWDGQDWTARRRWTAGRGWVEAGDAPAAPAAAAPPQARHRTSANPYSPVAAPRTRSSPASFSLAVLVTLVCGIALMFGSVGTWIQVQGTSATAPLNGLDQQISVLIGVNGYVTFIGGIVLVVLGGLALSSEEKLLVVLTTLVSLAVLVFAVFDVFRIVQKISQLPASVSPHVSVGWGLICVLSAAVLAMLVSLARLLAQR